SANIGWESLLTDQYGEGPEVFDRFIELLQEFRDRTPRLVARLNGINKTYQRSVGDGPTETRHYPESIDLIAFTDDLGFFACEFTGKSSGDLRFYSKVSYLAGRLGADTELTEIFDKDWAKQNLV
ncbi:MAG: hypothetical protein ACPG4Q_15660, partial [Phycisphaeraceae bacterium]